MVQTNGGTWPSFQSPWGRGFYRRRRQCPKLLFKNFGYETLFLINCLRVYNVVQPSLSRWKVFHLKKLLLQTSKTTSKGWSLRLKLEIELKSNLQLWIVGETHSKQCKQKRQNKGARVVFDQIGFVASEANKANTMKSSAIHNTNKNRQNVDTNLKLFWYLSKR